MRGRGQEERGRGGGDSVKDSSTVLEIVVIFINERRDECQQGSEAAPTHSPT